MKRYIFLIAFCLACIAPHAAHALPSQMMHAKGVDGLFPMFMSEDEMLADGGYEVSHAVFNYKGATYTEVDFVQRVYTLECCDDPKDES